MSHTDVVAPQSLPSNPLLHPSVMLDDKLLEFVPGAVYVCDLDGVVVRYNRRAGEIWGRYPVPGDPKELYCGSHKLYRASGELMPHDETPMVDALRDGNSYRNLEVQVEQPSGRLVWIMVNIDPLRDDDGKIVGVINCFQDITDRKLADEHQKLLINELNHRVKNTLATVQAVAKYTFREGSGPEALAKYEARLMALSRTHDLLTDTNWVGAGLGDVVERAVGPLSGDVGDRLETSGPDLHLKPQLALSLATVLNELGTNAAKYGALSVLNGKISVSWWLESDEVNHRLHLLWKESGGPVVSAPTHKGFGTRVIEKSLRQEHGAQIALSFVSSGVTCSLEIPLE